jgi:hypothetical protein
MVSWSRACWQLTGFLWGCPMPLAKQEAPFLLYFSSALLACSFRGCRELQSGWLPLRTQAFLAKRLGVKETEKIPYAVSGDEIRPP